jgi:hypothetical protein
MGESFFVVGYDGFSASSSRSMRPTTNCDGRTKVPHDPLGILAAYELAKPS